MVPLWRSHFLLCAWQSSWLLSCWIRPWCHHAGVACLRASPEGGFVLPQEMAPPNLCLAKLLAFAVLEASLVSSNRRIVSSRRLGDCFVPPLQSSVYQGAPEEQFV